jgi:hypothetical protein
MNRAKWAVVLILIALAIIGIGMLAYRGGYAVGSDMAERDNRTEAR